VLLAAGVVGIGCQDNFYPGAVELMKTQRIVIR